jgi:hypothetical protein
MLDKLEPLPSDVVAAYVQSKRIALARELRPTKKVYLDTKYWALLRDARLGRPKSQAVSDLLCVLQKLVEDHLAICPINADVYFEVFKQNDPKTLRANVELMDDLSLGVSLISMPERINAELFHFVELIRLGPERVFALDELMWTKAAYVIGFVTPNCYGLPRAENITIQKSFADFMWELRLIDMLDTMGDDVAAARVSAFKDISSDLNDGKFGSIEEHNTFESLYLCEIRGLLDAHLDELTSLMAYLSGRNTGQDTPDSVNAANAIGRIMAKLIYEAFRLGRTGDSLPSIRVGAGLHAALRWDRKRKYKANDQFDFRHAEAALPYCDYFLTERSLRHLVNDGNLKFPTEFNCQVCSDPEEAVASLSVLAS